MFLPFQHNFPFKLNIHFYIVQIKPAFIIVKNVTKQII